MPYDIGKKHVLRKIDYLGLTTALWNQVIILKCIIVLNRNNDSKMMEVKLLPEGWIFSFIFRINTNRGVQLYVA